MGKRGKGPTEKIPDQPLEAGTLIDLSKAWKGSQTDTEHQNSIEIPQFNNRGHSVTEQPIEGGENREQCLADSLVLFDRLNLD